MIIFISGAGVGYGVHAAAEARAYWEIFEYATGARFGLADTITDLLVDSAGAVMFALVALVLRQRGQQLT